jgi:DNA-binding LacI/PurR family transcriptional regulator
MRSHGLSASAKVIPGAHTENAGMAAGRTMLAETELPTAVLAGNDRCALGLLDVFTRAGVDVPGQLSLIGYDDSALSDNPRIDLTTVHQDAAAIARHAVRIAVDLVENNPSAADDVVLDPTLVIRGTTAAPRRPKSQRSTSVVSK